MEPVSHHGKTNHLLGQMSLEQVYPHRILTSFFLKLAWTSVKTLAIELVGHHVHGICSNLEFQRHFCKKFTWTSVKTVAIKPVGHHGQNAIFKVKQYPKKNSDLNFFKKFHGRLLRPLLWSQLALTSKTAHFQCQTSPGNSNVIFSKNLHGRPLRP
ncbi:hypothetical protein H5410_031960 [Solanum commersonii]|uniref:Uncharacterized protein n=1 Tax=Solanum commersonii TaxID=4109 RepID=A0A9J5YNY3_SOLCO|nr:hypothetical protein H5410_031960 [Solanum commersonii]